MKGRSRLAVLLCLLVAAGALWFLVAPPPGGEPAPPAPPAPPAARRALSLPAGFAIARWAGDLPDARALARGEDGTVYVGSRGAAGRVWAVRDADGDGAAEGRWLLAEGLTAPIGLDLHGEDLYVSARSKLLKLPGVSARLADPPPPVTVLDTLPNDRSHGGRYMRFGPDGWLYFGLGARCNICLEQDPRFASICRVRPDGSGLQVYAHGVRNSVGFDWDPRTGALWFTDNGRDMMGDDVPPDELNRATQPGQHFGYPYCHGGVVADPEFNQRPCADFVAPRLKLQAHVAPLGMRFYRGDAFPPRYRGAIFLAQHGSWNRSSPVGYRVVAVFLDASGKVTGTEVFVDGWLQSNDTRWGRPVDLLELADGSLLISDDFAGVIWRVWYRASAP